MIYVYFCCCLALEEHKSHANMPIHFALLVVNCSLWIFSYFHLLIYLSRAIDLATCCQQHMLIDLDTHHTRRSRKHFFEFFVDSGPLFSLLAFHTDTISGWVPRPSFSPPVYLFCFIFTHNLLFFRQQSAWKTRAAAVAIICLKFSPRFPPKTNRNVRKFSRGLKRVKWQMFWLLPGADSFDISSANSMDNHVSLLIE